MMRRQLCAAAATMVVGHGIWSPAAAGLAAPRRTVEIGPEKRLAWLHAWQQNILTAARTRYCDTEMGEEIGWLISPLLEGFYHGYLATHDARWIDRLIDWTDAWIRRGAIEPDGFLGWPKVGAAGTDVDSLNSFHADSLLGEAMVLRPVVLTLTTILRDPGLVRRYGEKARSYLRLASAIYDKWERRGAWRAAGEGMITVVLPFGIDLKAGRWTDGIRDKDNRHVGFSHPDNKANRVALWLMAMHDATGEQVYRERAEAWFRVMKARVHPLPSGTDDIWNYWEPAGPWDFDAFGKPKHWVGVHPNAGYYNTDVQVMVEAYEHGIVFTADDLERLIRTALATGRPWTALAPYDPTIRARFEQDLRPNEWSGLSLVPWYLALQHPVPSAQTSPRSSPR
jgi:hypothetical protein